MSEELRLCGYCQSWHRSPCGDGCHWSPSDPTVWQLRREALAASECAPSGEPSEEAINKSFEFLNMRLCEFGDKAEMRNLLRAAYAIDAIPTPPAQEEGK